MGQLEKSRLNKIQVLLNKSTISQKISSSVKTAYSKLGKRIKLKNSFENSRSGNAKSDTIITSSNPEIKNEPFDRGAKKPSSDQKREIELKQVVATEASSGCQHHRGYLAKRDSKRKIPDQCMICEDLLECLQ